MNEVTEEKKTVVLKSLAVIGFVATVVFSVWLAVQIVQYVPTAFTSLASLAEGIQNVRTADSFRTEAESQIVEAGENFTISWDTLRGAAYTMTYECTDGVAFDIARDGDRINIECDIPAALADTVEITARIASEKNRFSDVAYIITAIDLETGEIISEDRNVITVVNNAIPTDGQVAAAATSTEEATVEEETEDVAETNTPETVVTPEPNPSTPSQPTVIETPIYAIPTSDPNGVSDLAVTFIAYGVLDRQNRFTPRLTVDEDENVALQFEVRNIGSKTSERWTYEAELPGDIRFESNRQTALRPNERALITLNFELTDSGSQPFEITVDADDLVERNNTISGRVLVTD